MRPKSTEPLKKKHWNEECIAVLFPKDTKEQFFNEIKEVTGKSATGFMKIAVLEYVESHMDHALLTPVEFFITMPKSEDSPSLVMPKAHRDSVEENKAFLERMLAYQLAIEKMKKEKYAALQKYQGVNYDKTKVWVPIGKRQLITNIADKMGLSTSRLVLYTTVKKLEKDYGFTTSCLSAYLG